MLLINVHVFLHNADLTDDSEASASDDSGMDSDSGAAAGGGGAQYDANGVCTGPISGKLLRAYSYAIDSNSEPDTDIFISDDIRYYRDSVRAAAIKYKEKQQRSNTAKAARVGEEPLKNMNDSDRCRLINCMFSDMLAAPFLNSEKRPDQPQLDAGMVGAKHPIWAAAVKLHMNPESDVGTLLRSAQGMEIFSNVDVSKPRMRELTPAKARQEWQNLRRGYNDAMEKFNRSGTHEDDTADEFGRFCDSKPGVVYL